MIVKRKPLSFWERLYLPAIFGGIVITIKHFFRRKSTIRYPEHTRELSEIWRGQHVLKRDDQGRERCTACSASSGATSSRAASSG